MILATKPLNDGTKGFRFNLMGRKGVYRKRSRDSRGWLNVTHGEMKGYHMGKRSLYIHKPQAPALLKSGTERRTKTFPSIYRHNFNRNARCYPTRF